MKKLILFGSVLMTGVVIGMVITIIAYMNTTQKVFSNGMMMQEMNYIMTMKEIKSGNTKSVIANFEKYLEFSEKNKNELLSDEQNANITKEINTYRATKMKDSF